MNGIDMKCRIILSCLCSYLFIAGVTCSAQQQGQWAVPSKDGGTFRLQVGNQSMDIDANLGARITSFLVDGRNFLTDARVDSLNWGSTFWPSPQSDWNWPPPAAIDNEPYTASIEERGLKLVSKKSPAGLIITKRISGDLQKGCFLLDYTITNASGKALKAAPWEVTRVKTGGMAFYPMGAGIKQGGLLPLTQEKDGIAWFVYREDGLPSKGDRQLYSDGSEGWLAAINGRTILVKQFPDIPPEKAAPKEGEVELYASPLTKGDGPVETRGYVEIEHQGAFQVLEAGASSSWHVTWLVRQVPDAIDVKAGSPELVEFVRRLVKKVL
jgi:hypothetical protein